MKLSLLNSKKNAKFFYFIFPTFYILFGLIYAIPFSTLNIISFFVLYLFVLLTQLLETYFRNYFILKMKFHKKNIGILEFFIGLSLLYFIITHSWVSGLLLVCYTLMVQGKYLFIHYGLDFLSISLTTLFKSLLLNIFGFYIHTGFISNTIFIYLLPLIIPIFSYEYYTWNKVIPNNVKYLIAILSYLLTITLTWSILSWWSLLLLLSAILLPLFLLSNKKQSILFFSTTFTLNYFILLLVFILVYS